MSMGGMSCSCITASSVPRRPRMPPCTFGCRVFTRPSMISGKPVQAPISVTGMPASCSWRQVPPVDRSSTPSSCSARAKSVMPRLSETLSRARRTTTGSVLPGRGGAVLMAWTTCGVAMESGDCSEQSVLAQFLAQGAAVEAEHARGNALVAARLLHHCFQQRRLDFVEHHRVKLADEAVVDLAQVFAERRAHAGAQRLLAAQRRRAVGPAHAASAWLAPGKPSKKASTRASCSLSEAAVL